MNRSGWRRLLLAFVSATLGLVSFLLLWCISTDRVAEAIAIGAMLFAASALGYMVAVWPGAGRTHLEGKTTGLTEHDQILLQRVHELSILHEIALAANAGVGVDHVLHNVTQTMRKTLPYTHLALFLIEPQTGRLIIHEGYGGNFDSVRGAVGQVGVGITGAVAASGETMVVPDVHKDNRYVKYIDATLSEICVPLKLGERIIGVINVESALRDAFVDTDLRFLTTIANQLAMIIENARLFDETQQWASRLAALHTASQTMIAQLHRDEMLAEMVRNAAKLFAAPAATVVLLDSSSTGATVVSHGLAADTHVDVDTLVHKLHDHALVGNGSATPIAGGDVRSLLSIAGNDTQTPKGGLLVFLHTGERTVGALAIWDVDGRRVFLTQEQALAQAFAALAAIAVDNARLHEQFSEQAKRDSLTQVYNHSYLLDRITDAVANAHQTGAPVSFLMLDIDDFKGFNDRYGHTTGDVVLRSIVQAIRSNVNSTDVIGRWGGEEFGLILYGATAQQAEMVAQRIRTTVANLRLVNHAGESITNPTVSQGIAAFPTHAQTGEQLIEAADSALYRAKACGKDQTAVASTPAANTAEEHA